MLKNKLKKRLGGLSNLKWIMNTSLKKNIVQGVFNSFLCYCLALFGGCSVLDLKFLQVQQNKAAQIVLGMPPRSHRDYMFDKLNWLTVNQLIVYHTSRVKWPVLTQKIRKWGAVRSSEEQWDAVWSSVEQCGAVWSSAWGAITPPNISELVLHIHVITIS